MMNVQTRYIRKGKVIRRLVTEDEVKQGYHETTETFKSINAAKHSSMLLQKANGGLGKGFVRVER
jgi:hypothetical protein